MSNKLYPEKPGVIPGQPLPQFAELPLATANRMKRIAASRAHGKGYSVKCSSLTKTQSRLIIGVCETRDDVSIEQHGKAVCFHLGGAR